MEDAEEPWAIETRLLPSSCFGVPRTGLNYRFKIYIYISIQLNESIVEAQSPPAAPEPPPG